MQTVHTYSVAVFGQERVQLMFAAQLWSMSAARKLVAATAGAIAVAIIGLLIDGGRQETRCDVIWCQCAHRSAQFATIARTTLGPFQRDVSASPSTPVI